MTRKKKRMMMIESNEKTSNDSEQPILVHDLIRSILERLSFVDFHRARCVSSGWYSASESCIRGTNPTTPWLILFPKEDVESNNGSCKLYDPRHHTSYTVKDVGSDFARSRRCLASSGSWFLMLDHRTELYILNLFTRQMIPLPSLKSIDDSDVNPCVRRFTSVRSKNGRIRSAVLWVDEESRDFLVVWNFDILFAYHKRGDNNESWKVLKPCKNDGCVNMVFKQGKLYVLSLIRNVTVFDFSCGDSPTECASFPSPRSYDRGCDNNLAVTLSGEVLIISSQVTQDGMNNLYFVYKMDPKSSEWIMIKSIGDEVLLLDLGITVAAKDMKNCIYVTDDQFRRYSGTSLRNYKNGICVYHIRTDKIVQVFDHLTASSPLPFKDARWFFPTIGGKWLH